MPDIYLTDSQGNSQLVDISQFPVKRSVDHDHHYEEDPSDETDHYIAMVCDCGFGYLLKKP